MATFENTGGDDADHMGRLQGISNVRSCREGTYQLWYATHELDHQERLIDSWKVKTVERLLSQTGGNLILSQERLIYEPFGGMQGKRHLFAPAKALQNSLIKLHERHYPIDLTVAVAGTDARPTIVVATAAKQIEFLFTALRAAERTKRRNEAHDRNTSQQ